MVTTKHEGTYINPEVFDKARQLVPMENVDKLVKSGIFNTTGNLKGLFDAQGGSLAARQLYTDELSTNVGNYNGVEDQPAGTTIGEMTRVVQSFGRMYNHYVYDWTTDAALYNQMQRIVEQIARNDDRILTDVLVSQLAGIFGGTGGFTGGAEEAEFAEAHTVDIDGPLTEDVVLDAIQQASGEYDDQYTMFIGNSKTITNLKKKGLAEYIKGTDAGGYTRDVPMYTMLGKDVIKTDILPKTKGETGLESVSYIVGTGAWDYEDIPVNRPYYDEYDAKSKGGVVKVYYKWRKVLAPKGFSFESATPIASPTNADFANGANWKLASDGDARVYNHKFIPIIRINSVE